MRRLPRLLVASVCLLGLGGLPVVGDRAIAQSTAPSLEQSEGLASAERLIQQSITLAEQGDFEAAISMAREAFILRGNLLGREHPAVASALGHLGTIYYLQGDYEAAVTILDRAMILTVGAGNTTSLENADRIQITAEAYHALADYEATIRLYKIALSIREELLGSTHPEIALSLVRLAALHRQQGDVTTALSLEERARAIQQSQQ